MAQKNIVLKGATYNGVESITLPVSGGGDATFVETSDANAVAADIAQDKTAYVNGSKITGTASGGSTTLIKGVIRPDAELIQTWSADRHVVEDDGVTLPSYSTTATTLVSGTELSPTVTADQTNYRYYLLYRALTIPEYNTQTLGAGRFCYHVATAMFEGAEIPAGTFESLDDHSKAYGSALSWVPYSQQHRCFYYQSATYFNNYSSYTGTFATIGTSPSASSNPIAVTSPNIRIQGNTTYFNSTYYNALTDIRYQYKFELYRVPVDSLNIEGWGYRQLLLSIADDIANNNGTLR